MKDILNLEVFCDEWLSFWTGNQPSKLIEFYSDDIYYQDPGRPHGISGKADLHSYLKKLLRKFPNWIWKRQELYAIDSGFILKWSANLADGATFHGLDIVEVTNNKITRNEVYFDPSVLRR